MIGNVAISRYLLCWRLRENLPDEFLPLAVSRVELQGRLALLARLPLAIKRKINPGQTEVTRRAVLKFECGLEFINRLLVLAFRREDLRQVQVRLAVAGGQRCRFRQLVLRFGKASLVDKILAARFVDSSVFVSRHTCEPL